MDHFRLFHGSALLCSIKRKQSLFFTAKSALFSTFFLPISSFLIKLSSMLRKKCRTTFWTFTKGFLLFFKFDNSKKKAKRVFHRKDNFFIENCAFNVLLGVTQIVLQLAQWLLEVLLQPIKLSFDVLYAR